jgi:hypothetical protein
MMFWRSLIDTNQRRCNQLVYHGDSLGYTI